MRNEQKMKTRISIWVASGISLLAGACGGVPEVLIDAARESAKEAVRENVDELVNEFADEILDPEQLELLPIENDEE